MPVTIDTESLPESLLAHRVGKKKVPRTDFLLRITTSKSTKHFPIGFLDRHFIQLNYKKKEKKKTNHKYVVNNIYSITCTHRIRQLLQNIVSLLS